MRCVQTLDWYCMDYVDPENLKLWMCNLSCYSEWSQTFTVGAKSRPNLLVRMPSVRSIKSSATESTSASSDSSQRQVSIRRPNLGEIPFFWRKNYSDFELFYDSCDDVIMSDLSLSAWCRNIFSACFRQTLCMRITWHYHLSNATPLLYLTRVPLSQRRGTARGPLGKTDLTQDTGYPFLKTFEIRQGGTPSFVLNEWIEKQRL